MADRVNRVTWVLTTDDKASGPMAAASRKQQAAIKAQDTALRRASVSADALGKSQQRTTKSTDTLAASQRKAAGAASSMSSSFSRSAVDIDKHRVAIERDHKAVRNFLDTTRVLSATMKLVKPAALVTGFGLAAQAASALSAGIVGLTGALAPLGGALAAAPAAIGAIVQGMTVWKLATKGITQALGGSEEALKKLTPQARKFVEELQPRLEKLQKTAQRGIFRGLGQAGDDLLRIFPVVNRVVARTSAVLGGLIVQGARLASTPLFRGDLERIGNQNARTLQQLGTAGLSLVSAFRHIVVAAQPLVDWMGRVTVNLARQIDQWAAAGRSSGRFAAFFAQTRSVMERLGSILFHTASGLGAIVKAGQPLGNTILRQLDILAQRLDTWTHSLQGQNALRQYFADAQPALMEAGRLIGSIGEAFLRLGRGNQVAPLLRKVRTELVPAFEDMIESTTKSFGPAFVDALVEVTKLFTTLAGSSGVLTMAVKLFTELLKPLNWIIDNVPGVGAALSSLLAFGGLVKIFKIGATITGLSTIAGMLKTLGPKAAALAGVAGARPGGRPTVAPVTGAPVPTAAPGRGARLLSGAQMAGFAAIGVAIGNEISKGLLKGVTDGIAKTPKDRRWADAMGKKLFPTSPSDVKLFPGIQVIVDSAQKIVSRLGPRIWGGLTFGLGTAWRAVKGAFNAGISWLGRLPSRIGDALSGAWRGLRSGLSAAWNWVKGVFSAGVRWVGKIPGRIGDALSGAWRGVRSGLSAAWNWVRGAFGDGVRFIGSIPRRIARALSGLWSPLKSGVSAAIHFVADRFRDLINFLRDAVGKIKDFVSNISDAISSIPHPPSLLDLLPDIGGRKGGFVHNFVHTFAGGGEVPTLMSGGEMYLDPRAVAQMRGAYPGAIETIAATQAPHFAKGGIIPGDPRSDSTFVMAEPGGFVLTGDGQRMLAGMMGYARGGTIRGKVSTFGPPGEAAGSTAYGFSSADPGIAVNPKGGRNTWNDAEARSYGKKMMHVQIGGKGALLRVIDKGPSIPGRKIDVTGAGAKRLGINPRSFPTDSIGVASTRPIGGRGETSADGARGTKDTTIRGHATSTLDALNAAQASRLLPDWLRGTMKDAFSSGVSLGGAGLAGSDLLEEIITSAAVPVGRTPDRTIPGTGDTGGDGGGGGGRGSTRGGLPRNVRRGQVWAEHRLGVPYKYGGGHNASFSGPWDCSGFVSGILHAMGLLKSPVDTTPLKSFGRGGPGKFVTIGVRGSSGHNAHTMIKIGRSYYESGGSGPSGTKKRSSWDGNFPIKRHPKGLQRGGFVGPPPTAYPPVMRPVLEQFPELGKPSSPYFVGWGLRRGGRVRGYRGGGTIQRFQRGGTPYPGAPLATGNLLEIIGGAGTGSAGRGATAVRDAMRALADQLQDVAIEQMEVLIAQVRARIEALARGGVSKREHAQVQRLSAVISLLEATVGDRVGGIMQYAQDALASIQRTGDQIQRNLRRAGVDPSSALGLGLQAAATKSSIPVLQSLVAPLQSALNIAKQHGDTESARTIAESLATLLDQIDEAAVSQIELLRQATVQVAQEGIDRAQNAIDKASALFELGQAQARVGGVRADSPAALRAQSQAAAESVPRLQDLAAAFGQSSFVKALQGDITGARADEISMIQAQTQAANAQADSADLLEQAAEAERQAAEEQAAAAQAALQAAIDLQSAANDLASAQADYTIAQLKLGGLKEGSPALMRLQAENLQALVPGLEAMAHIFQDQAWQAFLAGDETKRLQLDVQKFQTLTTATNNLVEAADLLKQAIQAETQALVDFQSYQIQSTQSQQRRTLAAQRLNLGAAYAADSPEVLRLQAKQLQIVAAGQFALAEQLNQASIVYAGQGDFEKSNEAFIQKVDAQTDAFTSLAEAADNLRQAFLAEAQSVVDARVHRTTLDQALLTGLELQQRLAGTFDTGGAARAAFITAKIIPDLQKELAALQNQLAVARQQGDQKLADQIAEAIAGKSNDILQAQLDAQEAIKENTEPLKNLTGPVGFEFRGQTEIARFASALTGG